MNEEIKSILRKNEGLSLVPYHCPAGKVTIGYGHNLTDNGIPIHIAEQLLDYDLKQAQKQLFKNYPSYSEFSENRKNALIDMVFNIGIVSFKKFKNMHRYLEIKDFDMAAAEMLNSKYAVDVPKRAGRNAKIIKNG